MRIGKILRKWRIVNELSIKDVAGSIGLAPSTLFKIENDAPVDAPTLMRLINWLTETEGEKNG
jgi:transcriptional regulator with XRE-family HTH domain